MRSKTSYAAGLVLAVTTLAGVAGCGQPDAPRPSDDDTVSVAMQTTIAPLETLPEAVDTSVASSVGTFDLGEALTTTSCAQTGGTWSYVGSFVNPTDEDLNLSIAISLVSTADTQFVETHELQVTAPARASVPVEAKAFYSGTNPDPATIQCVTGVTDKDEQ